MLVGLVIAAAWAEDPSGARPGLGPPVLTWSPVVQLVGGVSAPADADTRLFASGRVGIEAERKVLTARLSVRATTAWGPDAEGRGAVTLGEAWARYRPPISSALGAELTLGVQPLEFDGGVLVGDDDAWRTAELPLAARAQLRAVPWTVDIVSAYAPGAAAREAEVGRTTPFSGHEAHLVRVAAGRDHADTAWEVSGLVLALPRAEPDTARPWTVGSSGGVQLRRIRLGADAYLQPTGTDLAWFGELRAGWAFGDEARVVLWGGGDLLSGGPTPAFRRPLADRRARLGWLGRFDDEGARGGDGAADAWLRLDATLAPQLRTQLAAHHLWDGAGGALGPELDATVAWYWSPLAALRLAAGWAPTSLTPAARAEAVIDVSL